MKFLSTILMFGFLHFQSCKPKEQSASVKPTTPVVAEPAESVGTSAVAVTVPDEPKIEAIDQTSSESKSAEGSYRFIVSFISIGEGPDRNGKEIFNGVIENWKTNRNKEIKFETVPWGREGEVDFCFELKELDARAQSQFINSMKKNFSGHSLVQFSENEACKHKR